MCCIHLAVGLVLEVVVVAAAASVEEQLAPRRGQVEVVPPQELGRVHRVARPGVLPVNIFITANIFFLISDLDELADAVRAAVGLDGEGEPQREVVVLLVSVEAGQLGRQVAWRAQFGHQYF